MTQKRELDPIRMEYDDIAWARSDGSYDHFRHLLDSDGVANALAKIVAKHRQGYVVECCKPFSGSNSACLRFKFGDGGSALIRMAIPGRVMLYEKTAAEVAAIRFIADETTIPVPLAWVWGRRRSVRLGWDRLWW